jgi:hypothetical protein
MPTTTHQSDPDVERLRQQLQREAQARDVRLRDVEALDAYVRGTLVPYLRGLAGAVGYPLPPEPPT